jgi:hypothetical protein
MTDTGQLLRRDWLAHLKDIADLDLQRRTWLDPTKTNPHWSYVEFVCTYPDADQLKSAQERGWLSAAETKILSEFGRTLFAHESPTGSDWDNEAILNDPAWHEVVRSAQMALQELAKLSQL